MISDHTIGLECNVRSSPGATKNVTHVISEDYLYKVDYHSHMPLCNIDKGIEEINIEEVIEGWIQHRDSSFPGVFINFPSGFNAPSHADS